MRTRFRRQPSTPSRHRLVIALMGVIAMVGGMAPPAHSIATAPASIQQEQPQAVHEIIFPDVPGGFNGMKVGYTVTGAMLGNPQDYGISMRSYQGRLGVGTLTLSGWVEQTAGYGADVSVSVKVGDQEDSYDGGGSTPWRQEFSVSLPIPPGETKGSFSIWLTGSYNAGDRDIFINGSFAPENVVPVTVAGQILTPLDHTDSNRGFPAAVRASGKAPLAGVAVELVRVEQAAPGVPRYRRLAGATTNPEGKYLFANVPVTTSLAISAALQSADLWVWDAGAASAVYNTLPAPVTRVYAISQPFNVTGQSDVTADVSFDSAASFTYPAAGSTLLQRLDSFGLIYYHTWQALQLATQLGVTLDTKPLPVYGFLDNMAGAYWWGPHSTGANAAIPPHIAIGGNQPAGGVATSDVNDGGRADNREWHEFGHHFMADAFGNRMPDDAMQPAANHAGYMNASTGDSWTEGFAEFISLTVNREIAKDDSLPQLYHWAGSASNMEANWLSWAFHGDQSFEEFAVASLLWDLLDPADANDKTVLTQLGAGGVQTAAYADRVEVPLATLWAHLSHNNGGAYGYNLHMKQLYDVLKAAGVGATVGANGLSALDELFVAHGFFADTGLHLNYFDAGETVGTTGYLTYTVIVAPPPPITVPMRLLRPSPPPVPDAYVEVAVVNETEQPIAATQFLVDVRFDAPFALYNFSYEATAAGGRLFFLPAPAPYPGTISVTPKGLAVDAPLVLTNQFVWTAPANESGVIQSHTFHADTSSTLYLPAAMRQLPPTARDDFCNGASGWPDNTTSTYALHYVSGPPCQYQIKMLVDNIFAAATPRWSATDFELSGLARLDGAHAGGAGLLFGLNNDWSRFYVFGIGTNQKYWLSRFEGGAWADVIPSTSSALVNRASDNLLWVKSEGSQFTLYLNGSQVGAVNDGATHAGRVGLYAEGVAGFDARFHSYALWKTGVTGADEAAGNTMQAPDGAPALNYFGDE